MLLARPSDYFSGKITHKGKVVSSLSGTYLGFLNIDDSRYWDGRLMSPIKLELDTETLESDFRKRADLQRLKEYKIVEAQVQKELLEDLQRHDVKLRKTAHK